MISKSMSEPAEQPKKSLFRVTRTTEVLVWATSSSAAERLAEPVMRDSEDEYFTVGECPELCMDEVPVGAGVRVRCLLEAGEEIDPESLREAWRVTFNGARWVTDGFAAFPESIRPPFWVDFQGGREETVLEKVSHFASAHAEIEAGRLPKVALQDLTGADDYEPVYPVCPGYALAAKYADLVLTAFPTATWHHSGDARAAFAREGERLVAIVMPVRGRFGAVSST